MGAGKTTLGKAFAKNLGAEFIDLDWFIESRYHKSVHDLFVERGEDVFRDLERKALHEVSDFENVIISTGGGTPCFFDNMDYMNLKGITVFLNVHIDILFSRLRIAKDRRPILQNKSDEELKLFIGDALKDRLPFYEKAKYTFCADELEDYRQIDSSINRLCQLLQV